MVKRKSVSLLFCHTTYGACVYKKQDSKGPEDDISATLLYIESRSLIKYRYQKISKSVKYSDWSLKTSKRISCIQDEDK